MEKMSLNTTRCNFCGEKFHKGTTVLFKSIADPYILICEHCIRTCAGAMEDKQLKTVMNTFIKKPSEMKYHFDDYIVNQENAKKILSVAVFNHYKRVLYNEQATKGIKLKKSNVLMVGPTGTGKTLFVETIAKKLGVPFAVVDATSLTEAGYVGDDTEVCLKRLIESAGGDIERAERGIVFIDEIDKIGRKGENRSITRDVSGEGVQQSLLKMLEGNVVSVPKTGNRKHPTQDCYEIDTSNILFICGGAFEGIEKLIDKRLNKKSSIGFVTKEKKDEKLESFNELIHNITPKDLKIYGMMPELLGRLPVICTLEELNREALVNILTQPVDAITKQYQTLFEMDGIELEFTKDCLEAIADKANKLGTGARGLKAIVESFMTNYMYEIPELSSVSKVTLTRECVEKGDMPRIEYINVS